MTEGLKFQVFGSELKEHLQKRAKYHLTRAAEKEKEIPDLRKSLEKVMEAGKINEHSLNSNKYTSGSTGSYNLDPEQAIEQVEADIREHRLKAGKFDFYSNHLLPEYLLTASDLNAIEMTK